MELTLQHMVDQLADRLGRPALHEDRLLRLIAYSSHDVARLTGQYAPRRAAAGRPVRPFAAQPETVDHAQPIPPIPGPRLTLVRGRSGRGKAARAGLAGSLS